MRRLPAFLGMLAIWLGILLPAIALPCPQAQAATQNSCACCDTAMLAGGPSCAFACQPGATAGMDPSTPVLREAAAWFGQVAARLDGASLPPEAPPPR
jgi:hypothetical protein